MCVQVTGVRQVFEVLFLELREPAFQDRNFFFIAVSLRAQKIIGFRGLLGTAFQVLVQVQGGQLTGYFLCLFGVLTLEPQRECDRCRSRSTGPGVHDFSRDHIDVNVLAHFSEDLLGGGALALLLVQIILVNDLHQVASGHNPLTDHLDTLGGKTGHC